MSYDSIHNEPENAVTLCRWKSEPLTIDILSKLAEDQIFGWHVLLYGNTKFEDLAIVLAWFRCHWNTRKSAAMVGYADNPKVRQAYAIAQFTERVTKINSRNYLELVEACVNAGKITWEDVTKSLNYEPPCSRLSVGHKLWGYRLCRDAVKVYGGKRAAIKLLGTTLEKLNFWLAFGD